jgi:meiotic recombination protein REC8, fungi type
MLQDDPAYVPEIYFPSLNLDALLKDPDAISTVFETQSSIESAKRSQSSTQQEIGGLIIPSDSSQAGGGMVLGGLSESVTGTHGENVLAQLGDNFVLQDADFEFDEEGNILELPPRSSLMQRTPQTSRTALRSVSPVQHRTQPRSYDTEYMVRTRFQLQTYNF